MADLKIVADYSDIQVMRRELVGVAKDAKASASVFETAYKKVEAQQKRSLNAVKQQLAFSKRMEAQKAREAKVASAAAAEVAKEEERLKNKFVEGYTAMNIYTKEMNDLAVARKKDIITADEQKAAVASLNAQMKAGTGAFANAATGMQIVGKRANRTGVLAQQAGYQFGDFAVQVQSGTNPMIAFGQQATQLIGTFSMLARSTKAIMAFSALGVIVPVITAIAGAFMRTRPEAEKATTAFEGVKDALDEIEAVNFGGLGKDFLSVAKEVRQEFSAILSVVEEVARSKLEVGLTAPLKAVIKDLESFEFKANLAAQLGAGTPTFGGQFGLESMNEAIFLATQLKTLNGETKEELQGQLNAITDALLLRGLLTDEVKETLAGLAAEVSLVEDLGEGFSNSVDGAEKLLELTLKVSASTPYIPMSAVAVEAANAQAEMVKVFEKSAALKEELGEAAFEALRLSGVDMASGVSAAAVEAAKLAVNMGISLGLALDLVALAGKSQAENLFDTKVRTGAIPPQAAGDFNLEGGSKTPLALQTYRYSVDSHVKERERAARKAAKGGGGGAKVVDINEIIEARKQQAAQERVLIGLSGQQHEAQKIYYDLLKKNEDADIKLTETQLRGSANVIAAYEEQNRVLQEAEQQRQQLVSSIESTLEDGFMSMIDGTKSVKDAFRDMARDIIKELYRVLVVKKLVASISGFFGFADGGAFSGGSQIQAYADGGVVGGPTFFPMSGGKTGLMGEAGPEAIMPLKRGANGKLGVQAEGSSGGDINIVQNFSFAANGDDSVKKLIAQAAPQIANLTQKQIMDSRRRGGSMKAAFG